MNKKKINPQIQNTQPPIVEKEPSFFNEGQKKIWKELNRLDSELGNIYKGALRVLQDKNNPARLAQSAHSIRMLSAIFVRDVDTPIQIERKHREKLKIKIAKEDPLGGAPENLRNQLSKKWIELDKWFIGVAKYGKEATPDDFYKKLNEFEEVLWRFLAPHFEVIEDIDKIFKIKKPSKAQAIRLRNLLVKNYASYDYFFNKASSNWLSPLAQQGFFKNPPNPIRMGNYIRFPIWSESRYLARIAKKKPKKVFEIINACPKTTNPRIHEDFIEAALQMPSSLASKIISKVEKQKWLTTQLYHIRLPDRLADLMEKLAKDKKIEPALRLADLLCGVRIEKLPKSKYLHPEANPLYDKWQFEQIIEKKTSELKKEAPSRFISVLCKKLAKALDLERRRRNNDKKDYNDLSSIWRPNIASPRHHHGDVKNILITAIVETIQDTGKQRPTELTLLLQPLKEHKYQLFRRIELYIYHLFPEHFQKEIKRALMDEKILYAYNLRREYFPLLKEHFANLDRKMQKKILELIKKAPEFKKGKEVEELKNHWRLKYLHLIKDDLPNDWKIKYNRLFSKFGKPQYDDGIIKSWIGPTSPIKLGELKEKSVAETVRYLINWQPPEDFFGAPSPEGLGRLLSEVIKERPKEFSNSALLFYNKKIRPVYIYHLFWGLQQTLRDKKCFNWNPIIDLALKIVRSDKLETFEKSADKLEPNWDSVMKSIVDLYGDGFGSNCPIPFERRFDIWEAIEKISDHEEPTLEYEKEHDGENIDAASLSINTVRGEAMHSVIRYALWCARNLYPKEKAKPLKTKLAPEVKKVLDKHLDSKIDPSMTIHAVYGWYLPSLFYLDKKWVKDNLDKIFPKKPNLLNLWVAAFETYLTNSVYGDIFTLLRKEYLKAIHYIKNIRVEQPQKRKAADMSEKLPPHLMLAYAYDFDENNELTTKFFEIAPAEIRAKAIWFMGANILKKELAQVPKDSHSINLKKIQKIWDQRLLIDEQLKNKEELKEFGWWFMNSPYDKKWNIEHLLKTLKSTKGEIDPDHQIFKKLKEYAADFPLLTVNCLNLIARGDKENWRIRIYKDEWYQTLQVVMKSEDKQAIDEAKNLINYLGASGFSEFRDLLP